MRSKGVKCCFYYIFPFSTGRGSLHVANVVHARMPTSLHAGLPACPLACTTACLPAHMPTRRQHPCAGRIPASNRIRGIERTRQHCGVAVLRQKSRLHDRQAPAMAMTMTIPLSRKTPRHCAACRRGAMTESLARSFPEGPVRASSLARQSRQGRYPRQSRYGCVPMREHEDDWTCQRSQAAPRRPSPLCRHFRTRSAGMSTGPRLAGAPLPCRPGHPADAGARARGGSS